MNLFKPEHEKTAGTSQYVLRLHSDMTLVQYQLDLLMAREIPALLPVSVRTRSHTHEIVVDISAHIKLSDWYARHHSAYQSDLKILLFGSLLHILKCADDCLLPLDQLSSALDHIFISEESGGWNSLPCAEHVKQPDLKLIFWPVAALETNSQDTQFTEDEQSAVHIKQASLETCHDANHIKLIRNMGHFCMIDSDLISQTIVHVLKRNWHQALDLSKQASDESWYQSHEAKAAAPDSIHNKRYSGTVLFSGREYDGSSDPKPPDDSRKLKKKPVSRYFVASSHWLLLAALLFIFADPFSLRVNHRMLVFSLFTIILGINVIACCRQIRQKNNEKHFTTSAAAMESKKNEANCLVTKIKNIQERTSYYAWQFTRHWNSFFQGRQAAETAKQTHYHQTMIMTDAQQTYTMAILTEIAPDQQTDPPLMTRHQKGMSDFQREDHSPHHNRQNEKIDDLGDTSENPTEEYPSDGKIQHQSNQKPNNMQQPLKKAYILTDQFIIGRDPYKSDLYLEDESIGRQHARIDRKAGSFFLNDLGSANGSYINGKRANRHEETWLPDPCEIQVGALRFFFEIDG